MISKSIARPLHHHNSAMRACAAAALLVLFLIPAECSAGETELRFLAWRPQPPWIWDQAIAEFQSQNPGTRVVREVGPHSSTDFHDLLTQKLRNRDPELDVFLMDVIWSAEFAAAGWALPLDRWFLPEELPESAEGERRGTICPR